VLSLTQGLGAKVALRDLGMLEAVSEQEGYWKVYDLACVFREASLREKFAVVELYNNQFWADCYRELLPVS
jgi:hypothetical protein